jgi:Ca2+-binding EF-hand superfamily protein
MPISALILPILAAAAPAVPPSAPITVTGHAWAPFISPMGEPFRARAVTDDTLANWFRLADLNHDGTLTAGEMQADAERFFATLDSDGDGQIDPDELAQYEYEIAPDVQVMSRTKQAPGQAAPAVKRTDAIVGHGREKRQREREESASLGLAGALQGAARYGLLNMPEPVAAADADFNRLVSLSEFKVAAAARFQLLDRAHRGGITLAQLQALRPTPPVAGSRIKRNDKAADQRIGNPLPPGE